MISTKLKIGTISLLVTVTVIGGLIILNKQKPQETAIQLQEITVQPKNISCLSEFKKKADYIGLSCDEFIVLSTSVREYLYQRYPFLSETDFGIRYEKVPEKLKSVPSGSIIIDVYPTFETPPPIIRVAFHDERVYFVSFTEPKRDDA